MQGWVEKAKREAALRAVKEVKDYSVVGLGSGSTVAYAIQELGRRVLEENLHILGVATSHQSALLAVECGVPLTTLNEDPEIDVSLDGTDEVDSSLNAIKGAGGAFTMEKIVASIANKFILIADERKLVDKLGSKTSIPVEVIPSAYKPVSMKIMDLGGEPVLRQAKSKVGPVITDNGNFILDVKFESIEDPKLLDTEIKSIPGVIETGLFIDLADVAYIGGPKGVKKLSKPQQY